MKRFTAVIAAGLLLCAGTVLAGSSDSGGRECGAGKADANPHKTGRIASTTFENMDADGSGAISYEEFKAVFSRVSPEGFARLDAGGNGDLSKEEWQAFKSAHKGMGGGPSSP